MQDTVKDPVMARPPWVSLTLDLAAMLLCAFLVWFEPTRDFGKAAISGVLFGVYASRRPAATRGESPVDPGLMVTLLAAGGGIAQRIKGG